MLRLAGGTGEGFTFDPAAVGNAIYGNLHLAAVYDSLLSLPEGTGIGGEGLEPRVAAEWEYSEGNTVLSLRLRDDVVFSDGTPLDAEAVKANIEYAKSPDYLDSFIYGLIEEITVLGDHELELRITEPNAEFLLSLGGVPLVNPAAIADRDLLGVEPAGSGPYVLDDFTTDVSYTFVRNPDYWNPDAYPYDSIELKILDDLTARVNALKSGQVDVAGVDSATAAEVEAAGFETVTASGIWVALVLGDRRGEVSPPIGDLKVRQAISMAFDREGFAEAVEGEYGNASNQIGVEGQTGFYLPERADQYAYDLEAARELMAEAGYADGFDIDIPYWPLLTEKYRPYYDQAFTDLGIRVNWVTLTDDNAFPEMTSGKFAVIPWLGLATPGTFAMLYETENQLLNPWLNTDAEAQELLDTVNAGTPEEAAEAIAQLNKKVLDDASMPILTHVPVIIAFASDIRLSTNGNTQLQLQNIRPAD